MKIDETALRKMAEEILAKKANKEDFKSKDADEIIHELLVYQAELEIQNEELRSVQQQLEHSRNEYRKLYHHAPVGYLTLNEHTIIEQANQTFLELIGAEQSQVTARSFADLLSEESRTIFISRYKAFFKNPEVKNIELVLKTSRGALCINITGKLNSPVNQLVHSNKKSILIIVTDISERKRAENDLQAFFDLVPDMVSIISAKGDFLKVNKEWENTLGFTEEEMTSRPFIDFVHPEDKDASMEEFPKRFTPNGNRIFVNRYITKGGGFKWLEWQSTPLMENNVLYAAARDITERKTAEDQMNKLVNILQISNKKLLDSSSGFSNISPVKEDTQLNVTSTEKDSKSSKDKLFSIIAHDLRAPFTGFIGLSEILFKESGTISTGELRSISEAIYNSALSMYKLLNELLLWSSSQTGDIEFKPDFYDLFDIVKDTLKLLQTSIDKKHIEIISQVEPRTMIFCDAKMIQTVIRNFLDNAIKFSHQNGQIIIKARIEESNIAIINASYINIEIIDFGIGMSSSNAMNFFENSHHLTKKGTSGEQGAGLGMILAKEFIDIHKGRIYVKSEKNKGAVFGFSIPQDV